MFYIHTKYDENQMMFFDSPLHTITYTNSALYFVLISFPGGRWHTAGAYVPQSRAIFELKKNKNKTCFILYNR